MFRKHRKTLYRGLLLAAIGGLLVFGMPCLTAYTFSQSRLYSLENAPKTRVAIVFGAGLLRNGTPSAVLRDRVETAVQLYDSGKVNKLLMSGDNRFVNYNEPGAMRDYAVQMGVPEQDIVLDFAGRRTYDTCYRARYIFKVDQAILVTQGFHMPRALITCSNLGVEASGVISAVRQYRRSSYAYWYFREIPATSMALWEVWVSKPLPVLGDPEPIVFQDEQ